MFQIFLLKFGDSKQIIFSYVCWNAVHVFKGVLGAAQRISTASAECSRAPDRVQWVRVRRPPSAQIFFSPAPSVIRGEAGGAPHGADLPLDARGVPRGRGAHQRGKGKGDTWIARWHRSGSVGPGDSLMYDPDTKSSGGRGRGWSHGGLRRRGGWVGLEAVPLTLAAAAIGCHSVWQFAKTLAGSR